MTATEEVMAVVRVEAPSEIVPGIIEAEIVRAVAANRRYPMSMELEPAAGISRPGAGRRRRHAFVAVLSFGRAPAPAHLERKLRKIVLTALRRRFGESLSGQVRVGMTGPETDALWCTMRGTPHRPS